LTDLADTINVSWSTAHARLQRLRKTTSSPDSRPRSIRKRWASGRGDRLRRHRTTRLARLRTELASIPGVEYLAMCVGRFDSC
jgi:transposase